MGQSGERAFTTPAVTLEWRISIAQGDRSTFVALRSATDLSEPIYRPPRRRRR